VIIVAFIRLPAASEILPKGSSRHPRFPVVAGSLAHSRDRGKGKSRNTRVADPRRSRPSGPRRSSRSCGAT